MVHYFAKQGVVHYKRAAITSHTGIEFEDRVEELDKLVLQGILVSTPDLVKEPVKQVSEIKPQTKAAPKAKDETSDLE